MAHRVGRRGPSAGRIASVLALLLSALAVDATGQRSVAAAELPERPASSGAITFEGTGVQPLTPARLLDTRPTGTTIDGQFQATGTLGPDATTTITVTNRGGVPATGVAAVAVNITAVNPTTNTFITAYPTGTTRPNASTFNPRAGVTIANSAILKLGTNGQLTLYNQTGNVHLIIDVTGWYQDASAGTTTIDPGVGTTLVGAGDIVAVDDTTVTLAATAPVPVVDGYLVAFPGPAAPLGLSGRVVSVSPQPDGTTVVELDLDVTLQEMFHDLIIEGASSPLGSTSALADRSRAMRLNGPDLACGASGGVVIAPTFGVSYGGSIDLDLWNKQVDLSVSGLVTLGLSAGFDAAFTCSVPLPGRAVGAIGPVKLDLTGAVDVSVSGQATFDVSMEVLVSMGLTYDDGTLDTSSDADLLGDGSMSSTTEVAISAGVTGTAQATLFGITGFEIETGPTLSASYDAAGCFKVEASYQTSLSYVVKRWGADWTLSIGTSTVGPITIYQNDQCSQWTGSATVTDVQGPVWLGAVSGHRTYSVTIDNIENCIVSAGAILLCTGTGTLSIVWDYVAFYGNFSCPNDGPTAPHYADYQANHSEPIRADVRISQTQATVVINNMEPLSGAYPWSHEYSYHVFSDCYTGPNSGPIPAVVGGPQGVQQLFDIEVTSNGSTGSGEYTAIDNMNTATWDISRA